MNNLKQQFARSAEAILSNPKYSWLFVRQKTVLPAILRKDALLDDEVDLDDSTEQFSIYKSIHLSVLEKKWTHTWYIL